MFILESLLELITKQIDITAAFIHANMEDRDNKFVKNAIRFSKERQSVEAQEDSLWFVSGPSCILEVSC